MHAAEACIRQGARAPENVCSIPAQETAKHLQSLVERRVTKPRRETRCNLLGCPKLANRSQPLVGRSSTYCDFVMICGGGIAV